MELVKEMPEPQIVDQELVLMPLPQIILMLYVLPTELVVSPLGKDVCHPKELVQVIPVLPLVVLDILEQTDFVKEAMPLQVQHAQQKYVLTLPLLQQLMPPVLHIRSVVKQLVKDVLPL